MVRWTKARLMTRWAVLAEGNRGPPTLPHWSPRTCSAVLKSVFLLCMLLPLQFLPQPENDRRPTLRANVSVSASLRLGLSPR